MPRLSSILILVVPLSIVVSVLEEVIWVACTWDIRLGNRSVDLSCIGWSILSIRRLVDNLVIFWVVFLMFRGIGYYQKLRESEKTLPFDWNLS